MKLVAIADSCLVLEKGEDFPGPLERWRSGSQSMSGRRPWVSSMVALRWGRDRSTDESGDSNLHELAMDFSLRLRNRIVVDVLVDPIVFRARTAF